MKTKDFDYDLPLELIAQTPLEKRDGSRLLTLDKTTGAIGHHHFYDLPQFLRPGDCLVLNNSRVLPARLIGHRDTGGTAEVLLLTDRGDNLWECLVRPGKKLRAGARVHFGDGQLEAEIQEVLPDGNRLVKFFYEGIFLGGAGTAGTDAPAALHQRGIAGRRALPDRLLQGGRLRRCTHGRTALHAGAAGKRAGHGRQAWPM